MDLPALDISCRWDHRICGLVTSFLTYCDVFQVHSCGIPCQYFILFYGWIIFHCIAKPQLLYPFITWWTFKLFSFLAIMNNAAANISVYIFVQTYVCNCLEIISSYYLGVELLGRVVTLWRTFWEIVRLFSTVAAPFHFPTSNEQGSNFCASSPSLVIFCFLLIYLFIWLHLVLVAACGIFVGAHRLSSCSLAHKISIPWPEI